MRALTTSNTIWQFIIHPNIELVHTAPRAHCRAAALQKLACFPLFECLTGRPAGASPAYCEQGPLALPTAPVFRSQRGKGTGKTSLTKKVHGYQQPCGGWGRRHSEGRRHSDGMGPMQSTRPASRQSLSDLMDLNLSLKFDKTGKQSESRQPRKRPQEPSARSGGRNDGGTAVGEEADLIRHSRYFEGYSRWTSMHAWSRHRYRILRTFSKH